MDKECYVKIDSDWKRAEFMGVFQYSNVIDPSPMKGGHKGGTIAYPLALVRLNGKIIETKVTNVLFEKL